MVNHMPMVITDYSCPRCGKGHKATSKIGISHRQYAVLPANCTWPKETPHDN